jgi:hypothetical protein
VWVGRACHRRRAGVRARDLRADGQGGFTPGAGVAVRAMLADLNADLNADVATRCSDAKRVEIL